MSSYFKLKQKEKFPLSSLILFTALLICIENTFWNISSDDNFVKSFKKSFTLFVDSGMKMKVELEANKLRSEQRATEDFKAAFFELITNHYLPHSNSGDQAFVLEQRDEKDNLTWLKKLKLKIGMGRRL